MKSSILAFLVLLAAVGIANAQTVVRQATVTWTAPTTCQGGAAITNCPVRGYVIQKLNGTTWAEVGTTAANVLSFTHRDLPLGTHTYRVLAASDAGNSAPSVEGSKVLDVPGAPGSIVITVTVTVTP